MSLDRAEIREIAEEVAAATVARTFIALGMDTSSASAIKDMQADFAFIRRQRESGELFRKNLKKTIWSITGAVLLGFVGWLLATFHLPPPVGGP